MPKIEKSIVNVPKVGEVHIVVAPKSYFALDEKRYASGYYFRPESTTKDIYEKFEVPESTRLVAISQALSRSEKSQVLRHELGHVKYRASNPSPDTAEEYATSEVLVARSHGTNLDPTHFMNALAHSLIDYYDLNPWEARRLVASTVVKYLPPRYTKAARRWLRLVTRLERRYK